MLSTAAFNAFLKTLEEPPAHAKFILATTEKHKILPTILSRCQIFDFNRMKVEDIVGHLQNLAKKEGVDADIDGLNVIAQKNALEGVAQPVLVKAAEQEKTLVFNKLMRFCVFRNLST